MRLIHFADLHLGIETYGSYDTARGMSSRVADFLDSFDRIVDYAVENEADAVLFAGDAFKNRDPSPTLQREFALRIVRLSRAGIPIVLLVGNHDLPSTASRATHTEIYQVLETPGVYVCRDIEAIDVPTRSGPLQIVAVPWVTRSTFLADESFRILADSDLDRAMGTAVSASLRQLASELDPAVPAVLVAHLSIQGATVGFERSIMLGRDLTVGVDDLHASAFDYVALGHIHKHQQVVARPPTVYSGSPERVDFGEEREDKGFIDIEIAIDESGRRSVNWTFITLPVRSFQTLRVDATGSIPMPLVEREISAKASGLAGAIVRCFVEVDPGMENSVPSGEVRRMLIAAGVSHVARVVVESDAINRPRIELAVGEEMDSATMLRRWIEQREIPAKLSKRMIEAGDELIERQRQQSERDAH
jgi:DNA repair protein SbcD/Mre11